MCDDLNVGTNNTPCLAPLYDKSQKSFLNENKCMHTGMEPSKTNQTRWEWHHNNFLHLVPFCQLAICFVVSIGGLWKAVGWVVLGVECMLMCMESELCCGWLQCTCSCYTEHRRYGLSWMQKLRSAWAGSVEVCWSKLCCEILLLWIRQIWFFFYVEDCGGAVLSTVFI